MNIEKLSAQLKAFSEPVRLRILYLLLEKGEVCVCDLVVSLGLTQSVVSRHLAYLKNNSLIEARREGTWMHYKVKPTQLPLIKQLLENFLDYGRTNTEFSNDLKSFNSSTKGC